MKNKFSIIIFIYLLIYCSDTIAQKNELRIQFNSFHYYNSEEEIEIDEINFNQEPREQDKFTSYDIGIVYVRKIDKVNWILSCGLKKSEQLSGDIIPRETFYVFRQNKRDEKNYSLSVGLQYPLALKSHKNLVFHVGALGVFSYRNRFIIDNREDVLDFNDNYLRGISTEHIFSDSWRAGILFNMGSYYYFFGKVGVGLEISNLLYLDRTKGNTRSIYKIYDQAQEVVDSIIRNQKDEKTLFSKSSPLFSLSIAYQF